MSAFATLRSLVPKPEAGARCEMCGASLLQEHRHLIDPESRRLVCACDACNVLFYRDGQTKFKSVPRHSRFLKDFQMTDAQWDNLMLPIGLAFFLDSSPARKVIAFYPSPAGAAESMLSLDAWAEIVAGNPVLASMQTDVEALLANRLDHRSEYYLAPIDKCYELIGLIRANWRGLSGGTEMWDKIHAFFAELKEGARA